MIFLGSDSNKSKLIFGIEFSRLANKTDAGVNFSHYYFIIHLGPKRFWIGYNQLKRKIRDKLYTINDKDIYFDKKIISSKP